MTAVRVCLRAVMRRRLRSTIALVVLMGVASGFALGALSGARRTQTSLDRFLAATVPPDGDLYPSTGVFGVAEDTPSYLAAMDKAAHLPEVASSGRSAYMLMAPLDRQGNADISRFGLINPFAAVDGGLLHTLSIPKILAGRLPRPDRPLEVVVSPLLARDRRLRPGSTFRVRGYARDQWGEVTASSNTAIAVPPRGPILDLSVVGVVREPADIQPIVTDQDVVYAGYENMYLGEGFWKAYGSQIATFGQGLSVHLRRGAADIDAYRRHVTEATGGALAFQPGSDGLRALAKTQRALHVQSLALYLFAAITALAAALILGQTVARQVFLDAGDQETLSALGLVRRQLAAVAVLRSTVIAVAGCLLGIIAAVATSPLMPIGLGREAEVHPGFSPNWPVLLGGATGVAALVLLRIGVPAWQAAGRKRRRALLSDASPSRRSRVGDWLSRVGFPPCAVTGVRMALEPGRGRTSVPVRSAIAGSVAAVAALAAAVTFTASLERLLASPRLQGWNWDAVAGNIPLHDADLEAHIEALHANPAIGSFSYGDGMTVQWGDLSVVTIGLERVAGDGPPSVSAGRAPTADDEVAFGARDLRRLHKHIGDTVVGANGPYRATFTIVGEVVLPPGLDDSAGLGQGALTSWGALRRFDPSIEASRFLVRYRAGADPERAFESLRQEFGRTVLRPIGAPDVENLRRVNGLPYALTALLLVLAAAAIGHALVSAIGRRAPELAVLKVLGFRKGQLASTVVWQATTIVVVALLLGLPLGVAGGRWAWRVVADGVGAPVPPITPTLPLLLAVPGILLLGDVVAAVPGWVAGRVRPALVLRSE